MPDFVYTITKWIVAFLVIFILCIILLLTFFNKKNIALSS
ncbi:hypothetical protein EV586_101855 [Tumebacillus sp. BK434]|nr:hypothetical protein EV586_101855 [Tumebacillus sp. BK434]